MERACRIFLNNFNYHNKYTKNSLIKSMYNNQNIRKNKQPETYKWQKSNKNRKIVL